MKKPFPKNQIETSTLKIKLFTGLVLHIDVTGANFKKERRTVLLHLFKALKKELIFIRNLKEEPNGFIYHTDSFGLNSLAERFTPASTFQATEAKTKMQRFGHRMRIFRNELGLTQLELSEIIDIDRTYISRIERGKHQLSNTTKKRIMDLLSGIKLKRAILQPSHGKDFQKRSNGPPDLMLV